MARVIVCSLPVVMCGVVVSGAPTRAVEPPRASNGAECSVIGTVGADLLVGTPGPDVICGLGGDDVLSGGGGDDVLDGGPGLDRLAAGPGRDLLFGGAGADRLSGGGGADTVSYRGAREPVRVDLDGQADDGRGAEADNVLADNENVVGGSANDVLVGSSASNRLVGGPGVDRLVGLAGDDYLAGGLGMDDVEGGPGLNTCVLDAAEVRDATCQLIEGPLAYLLERVSGRLVFDGENYFEGLPIGSYLDDQPGLDNDASELQAQGVIAADGSFVFHTPRTGTAFQVMTANGAGESFEFYWGDFTITEGFEPVSYQMPRLRELTVRVVTSRGDPLPGIRVSAESGFAVRDPDHTNYLQKRSQLTSDRTGAGTVRVFDGGGLGLSATATVFGAQLRASAWFMPSDLEGADVVELVFK